MTWPIAVSLGLLALAVESPARAEPVPDARPAAPTAAQLDVSVAAVAGAFTPIGGYGVEAQLGMSPWFALAAGVGVEPFGYMQAAAMPRVRVPVDRYTIYGGVGLASGRRSTGLFERVDGGVAQYLTAELGVELHGEHVFGRVFAGGKWMQNAGEICQPPDSCDTAFAYGGVALGVQLGL
jgi:hypothetical protein